MYERNPSYKIYETYEQVEHKLTARFVVISGARLIDNGNFFACIDRTKHGKWDYILKHKTYMHATFLQFMLHLQNVYSGFQYHQID